MKIDREMQIVSWKALNGTSKNHENYDRCKVLQGNQIEQITNILNYGKSAEYLANYFQVIEQLWYFSFQMYLYT